MNHAGYTETKFILESGVPIPKRRQGRIKQYPFKDLLPGDSFLIQCQPHECNMIQARVISAKNLFLKRTGLCYEFTTRRVLEGIRLWRVR